MRAKLLNGTVQWNAYHIAIFWGDTVAKYNVSSRRSQKIGLRTTKPSFFLSFFLENPAPNSGVRRRLGKMWECWGQDAKRTVTRQPRESLAGLGLGWGWAGAAQQRRAEGREGAHWKAEST